MSRLDRWMGQSFVRTILGCYLIGSVVCAPIVGAALLWNRYVA